MQPENLLRCTPSRLISGNRRHCRLPVEPCPPSLLSSTSLTIPAASTVALVFHPCLSGPDCGAETGRRRCLGDALVGFAEPGRLKLSQRELMDAEAGLGFSLGSRLFASRGGGEFSWSSRSDTRCDLLHMIQEACNRYPRSDVQ